MGAHEDQREIRERISKIDHKIVVASGKGGVGKSTVATNLAFYLAQSGKRVGILDVDINGPDIPKMLGIEDKKLSGDGERIFPVAVPPGLKVVSMAFLLDTRDTPVIWRGPVKMGAVNQFLRDVEWGELDFLVVDLPPGTGDEPLSIAQNIPDTDGCIIVTTPQEVALLDSRKAVNFARILNMPVIGIVENMSGFSCPHCGAEIDLFKAGGGEAAAKELGVPYLGSIPVDPDIVIAGDSGVPFVGSQDGNHACTAFKDIIAKVEKFVSVPKECPTDADTKRDAITLDMSIYDVVKAHPRTVQVFTKYGLGCLGCASSEEETIEQGARAHGIDTAALLDELNGAVVGD
jgi:hybrid cluster-associated redox disulfide protein